MGALVGIDVGGTFTDLAWAGDDGAVAAVLKVPSTPDDPSRAVLEALERAGVDVPGLDALVHGTTIATNAIIERTGARCALVTTRGFRDVLELGRRDRIDLYGLTGTQRPLIPRDDRWEVDERVDHRGQIVTSLDVEHATELAADVARSGVDVVVVALLHSYANPAHEEEVARIFEAARSDWRIVRSSTVVREYYEFERTSTAAVQGYLEPLVAGYAAALTDKLASVGLRREALVMQSNGGVVPVSRLGSRAAHIIRSGPAAGVMAAAQLAAEVGFTKIITGDMGGTSFDVAVVVDGEPRISETTQLDFRVPLRIPMIDVHTIGAGGGSIAWVDRGGTLRVGPRSAGAQPGPVCFRRGGTEPTVTDANIVLGRIDAKRPIGDETGQALDVDGARRSLGALGAELGLGVEEAAEAVLAVVNTHMAGRMRLITVDQGYDPRDFALVAFGGAGPLHAAALLRDVGVRTLLVPPRSGVLCAEGCLVADLRYEYSQTVERIVERLDDRDLEAVFAEQRRQGLAELAADGEELVRTDVLHFADMAYLGQVHQIRVRVEPDWDAVALAKAFSAAYLREYGAALDGIPILVVNARTSVRGVRRGDTEPATTPPERAAPPPEQRRPAYFGGAWCDTAVYRREALEPGMVFEGPAIVEQDDTTTVVEPGMRASVDGRSNLQVEVA
ncbi:MAG: hydantoinase/oxoprolinase family protein [Actinomycetota bacterium]|jgi:N-methylhydantoinase A|nr:hydantoinase/oxoprolinase family protein [Actinomycetota bacterium]MDA8269519.1 hydantoinase/oxoprolinase family protein [Actinomycetota bacterium]